jgi:inorganic pyrophosphatase
MKIVLSALAALFLSGAAGFAADYVALADHPQPADDGSEFYTAIEIPAGGFTKYEIDVGTGHIVVDRFVSMPVAYPANYGSITSSLGGDGDPLDALVYTREPIAPGAVIRVRPIGVLKMIDGGEVDDKIIAVPVSKVDPTFEAIKEVSDLPKIEQERLQAFFAVYKNIPEGSKKVELKGFEPAEKAKGEIASALRAYSEKK